MSSLIQVNPSSPSFILYSAVSYILAGMTMHDHRMGVNNLHINLLYVILLNAGVVSTIIVSKFLQVILLGSLRSGEHTRISSESWITLAESLLSLTIFRTELSPQFIFLFSSLLLLRPFHWIFMERSPRLASAKKSAQTHFLVALALLTFLDGAVGYYSYTHSVSPLLFLMESATLVLTAMNALSNYLLSISSSSTFAGASQQVTPQLLIQLAVDTLRFLIHAPFLVLTVRKYALPIHTLKDVYLETKSMSVAIKGLTQAREVHRWIEESLGEVASREECQANIKGDGTCLVCRDDLFEEDAELKVVEEDMQARILPCQHAFHLGCLRVWVERQQSCPTCRAKLRTTSHRHSHHSASTTTRGRYHRMWRFGHSKQSRQPSQSPPSSPQRRNLELQ